MRLLGQYFTGGSAAAHAEQVGRGSGHDLAVTNAAATLDVPHRIGADLALLMFEGDAMFYNHFQIQTHSCYSVQCAECIAGPDEYVVHFPDEQHLWQGIRDEGWTIHPDGRLLCHTHSTAAECDEVGHDWLDWWTPSQDPRVRLRSCDRCAAVDELVNLVSALRH